MAASHPVISINGDADFDAQAASEHWAGTGTAKNPYVIEDYDIDGLGWHDAITIGNTTVHFEIRGCVLHNSATGVLLWHVSNGDLIDNICTSTVTGIDIETCDAVELTNNNCSSYSVGILVYFSNVVNITGSTCSQGGLYGIRADISDSLVLHGNTVDQNGRYGVNLIGCMDSNLTENTVTSSGYGTDIYVETSSGSSLSRNIARIFIWQSSSLSLDHNSGTISLSYCSDSTLERNDCQISLGNSDRNMIRENNCSGATGAGIHLGTSVDNVLTGNNLSSMTEYGIWLTDGSVRNNLTDNICLYSAYGIYLYSSGYNNLSANNCSYNSVAGVVIFDCVYTKLRSTVMFEAGIMMTGFSRASWASHDIDSSNTVNGRPVYYASDTLSGSVPAGQGQVILGNCMNLQVERQNCSRASVGIQLGFCVNVTVRNSTCNDGIRGIYLDNSDSNNLLDNNCSHNGWAGIWIYASSSNTIYNNTCSHNFLGPTAGAFSGSGIMAGWLSRANDIVNNNCSFNERFGIYIDRSDSNEIIGNVMISNYGFGIFIDDNTLSHDPRFSYDNEIYGNTFVSNNGAGAGYDYNYAQAGDRGRDNHWNTTWYGNYWSDWQSPDANGDGIVDLPYHLQGNYDYYPLTTLSPIPEFSSVMLSLLVVVLALLIVGMMRIRPGR